MTQTSLGSPVCAHDRLSVYVLNSDAAFCRHERHHCFCWHIWVLHLREEHHEGVFPPLNTWEHTWPLISSWFVACLCFCLLCLHQSAGVHHSILWSDVGVVYACWVALCYNLACMGLNFCRYQYAPANQIYRERIGLHEIGWPVKQQATVYIMMKFCVGSTVSFICSLWPLSICPWCWPALESCRPRQSLSLGAFLSL